jgi:Cdc6-like AAA superfamily ATPase
MLELKPELLSQIKDICSRETKQLMYVLAPTAKGKTTVLCQVANEYLRRGFNVLFFNFEGVPLWHEKYILENAKEYLKTNQTIRWITVDSFGEIYNRIDEYLKNETRSRAFVVLIDDYQHLFEKVYTHYRMNDFLHMNKLIEYFPMIEHCFVTIQATRREGKYMMDGPVIMPTSKIFSGEKNED